MWSSLELQALRPRAKQEPVDGFLLPTRTNQPLAAEHHQQWVSDLMLKLPLEHTATRPT